MHRPGPWNPHLCNTCSSLRQAQALFTGASNMPQTLYHQLSEELQEVLLLLASPTNWTRLHQDSSVFTRRKAISCPYQWQEPGCVAHSQRNKKSWQVREEWVTTYPDTGDRGQEYIQKPTVNNWVVCEVSLLCQNSLPKKTCTSLTEPDSRPMNVKEQHKRRSVVPERLQREKGLNSLNTAVT